MNSVQRTVPVSTGRYRSVLPAKRRVAEAEERGGTVLAGATLIHPRSSRTDWYRPVPAGIARNEASRAMAPLITLTLDRAVVQNLRS
jgi:hypothetical protein